MVTRTTAYRGIYFPLIQKLRAIAALAIGAAALMSLSACFPVRAQSQLAIFDPVFAELFPAAQSALRKAGYAFTVISTEDSSRSFFDAIDGAVPSRIILSPLLAQEMPAIARSRPGVALGAIAFEEQGVNAAAAVLRFRGEDAARSAAEAVLRELKDRDKAREALAAAVFAGAGAERRAEAFKGVFLDANAAKLPIVEVSSSDWSPDIAARLASLDIALLYVSVPPKELGRWLRELSYPAAGPRSVFIIAESPQVPLEPWHNCDAIVYWHMEGSIKSLAELLATPQTEAIELAGAWHYKKLR
jgi:hypothetical protein